MIGSVSGSVCGSFWVVDSVLGLVCIQFGLGLASFSKDCRSSFGRVSVDFQLSLLIFISFCLVLMYFFLLVS